MRQKLGANYWRLWSASVVSNFGDGLALIAYPWLASTITRDGFKLGLVVLASRLPWLIFSIPAGVITDRFDRRRILVGMDLVRAAITAGVALMVVMVGGDLASPTEIEAGIATTPPNEDLLLGLVILAAFLLGASEVLRDNTAQTFLPAIVDKDNLEKANGRLWGAEMVMNQFAGPPVAGVLIGIGLAIPFIVHAGTFTVAAAVLFLIVGSYRANEGQQAASMVGQAKEGFRWLWRHPFFRPLAIALGIVNALSTMAFATIVLLAQEVLALEAAGFGLLMTAGAAGGVLGSLVAHRISGRIGKGPSLFATLIVEAIVFSVIGLATSAVLVWVMFAVSSVFVMLWNVVTVSLRQRVIPDQILGRVNSVYRFFGWGMMAVGAPVGGALVSGFQPILGREWALRLPLLVAGVLHLAVYAWALPRLNSARIAETEATAVRET